MAMREADEPETFDVTNWTSFISFKTKFSSSEWVGVKSPRETRSVTQWMASGEHVANFDAME